MSRLLLEWAVSLETKTKPDKSLFRRLRWQHNHVSLLRFEARWIELRVDQFYERHGVSKRDGT